MAAGHQPSPAPVEPARVEAWLKALQQALQVEADRGRAIAAVVAAAQPDDLVLIAGKGHEDYQILATGRIHFDDREQAEQALGHWSEAISQEPLTSSP